MKARKTKTATVVAIVGVVCVIVLIRFYGAQLCIIGYIAENIRPGIISSRSFLRAVMNPERDDAYSAYNILGNRKSVIARDIAIVHLKSDDDYLWLNAALYLGHIEEPASIPYLIKALRHTAWRSDEEKRDLLKKLTGEDHGTDFIRWHSWWMEHHEGSTIDWESNLGFRPRIKEKTEPSP